jgi:hypothetical protein
MKTILATALLLATAALTHAKVLVDLDFGGTNDFGTTFGFSQDNLVSITSSPNSFNGRNGSECQEFKINANASATFAGAGAVAFNLATDPAFVAGSITVAQLYKLRVVFDMEVIGTGINLIRFDTGDFEKRVEFPVPSGPWKTYSVDFSTLDLTRKNTMVAALNTNNQTVLNFAFGFNHSGGNYTGGDTVRIDNFLARTVVCVTNNANSGPGSLRQAIDSADAGDTIIFDPSLSGQTITLGGRQLIISKDLTIDASALPGGLTIDANGQSRVMQIISPPLRSIDITAGTGTTASQSSELGGYPASFAIDGDLTNFTHTSGAEAMPSLTVDFHRDLVISSLRIHNRGNCCQSRLRDLTVTLFDSAGGTIYTSGILNSGNTMNGPAFIDLQFTAAIVRKIRIQRNSSAAVGDDRALSIGELEVSGPPPVALHGLTLTGGSAGLEGGGIYNFGNLTLTQSTLSGNSATFDGGGISNFGTVTLTQSTISGNSAGTGGGIYNFGNLTLAQSTLSGNSAINGGGIFNLGTVTLTQSTLSGNSATMGGGIFNEFGTVTLTQSIVAGNPTGGNINGGFINNGNNLTSGDPKLAPFGDYGGHTQTMPPLPGSPAIDAGGSTALTTDQRGAPRTVGSASDIGAVEAFPFSTAPGFTDIDTDGIDDRLEQGIFGNLTTATATSDNDGDGSSDKDEISSMTNARDSGDSFRMISIVPAPDFLTSGERTVTFTTFPGVSYYLEASDTLAPGSFTEISGSLFTATNYTKSITVTSENPRDFFRAKNGVE